MMPHRAYFGDAEHDFKLTSAIIIELERKTGVGMGALCARVFNRQFALSDLHETIRLAAIGGGLSPERAAQLIAAYAIDRPLVEIYPLAVTILDLIWFGQPHQAKDQ